MKKIFLMALMLAGTFIVFPAENANAAAKTGVTAASEPAPQWQDRNRRRGRNRGWNNNRVYTQTKLVRRGRAVYRETYRVTVRNGRTTTTLISRTRVRA